MDKPAFTYWFPAKRYGWGWSYPTRREGWVVTVVWILLVASGSPLAILFGGWLAFGLFMTAMVVAIVAVCWVKGEPPRWRWGDDR
jgi:hypothetical protein